MSDPRKAAREAEFERIKAEEKAHLRQMRSLKGQHRDAVRKKKTLDALQGLARPDLDSTHDEAMDQLTQSNAMNEARFEIAMEGAGLADKPTPNRPTEEELEAMRKAEAAALVRQMKAETGVPDAGRASGSPRTPAAAPESGKSIGRTPPPADEPDAAADDSGPKTIGRQRG